MRQVQPHLMQSESALHKSVLWRRVLADAGWFALGFGFALLLKL